jgi:hypothetical protein
MTHLAVLEVAGLEGVSNGEALPLVKILEQRDLLQEGLIALALANGAPHEDTATGELGDIKMGNKLGQSKLS